MEDLNWISISVAAVSAFVLGGLWYSPVLFGKAWAKTAGLSDEQRSKINPAKTYGLSFVLCFLGALVFSMFLGPEPEMGFAIGAGFAAGLVWVAGSFGINYLFEQKPASLFFINGGYHTLQYTLYGLILAWL